MPKTFQTLDRALALRCKLARQGGKKITVNYETAGGWNRMTGMVRSVRRIKTRPLKPLWEVGIEIESRSDDDKDGTGRR